MGTTGGARSREADPAAPQRVTESPTPAGAEAVPFFAGPGTQLDAAMAEQRARGR